MVTAALRRIWEQNLVIARLGLFRKNGEKLQAGEWVGDAKTEKHVEETPTIGGCDPLAIARNEADVHG